MPDYGFDYHGTIPGRSKEFFSRLCFQIGSGAQPTSYLKGTEGSFPRDKAWPGRAAKHLLPSSVEVKDV